MRCTIHLPNGTKGDLDSYLIEITRDILGFKDEKGEPLVEKILDTAGQKGTGKWTAVSALDLGIPLTLIGESVFAVAFLPRKISGSKPPKYCMVGEEIHR